MNLDDAYANSAYIPDGETYFARWASDAGLFREKHADKVLGVPYGKEPYQTYDLFKTKNNAKGTIVFVHGGYWMACSPSDFSHVAQGAVSAGYDCVLPTYSLAPRARISEMTAEIRSAITAVANASVGPIYLVGHSAGAHLVARMVCQDIQADWQARVKRVMPISPLSDLLPLMQTSMNETLMLDAEEAERESPVMHRTHKIPVTVWVGGDERPAFLDQAHWLAQAWAADHVIEPARHHFDVIDGLIDAESAMMRALLDPAS